MLGGLKHESRKSASTGIPADLTFNFIDQGVLISFRNDSKLKYGHVEGYASAADSDFFLSASFDL